MSTAGPRRAQVEGDEASGPMEDAKEAVGKDNDDVPLSETLPFLARSLSQGGSDDEDYDKLLAEEIDEVRRISSERKQKKSALRHRQKPSLSDLLEHLTGLSFRWNDHDSKVMGCRVAFSITIASLLTFCFAPEDPILPHGSWVMTTAGTVAWNANLDSATALKKALERATGTAIGAVLGLLAGFISLAAFDGGTSGQAFLLAVGLSIESFLVPFLTSAAGYKASYAARLTCLTYGIMVLGFYSEEASEAVQIGLFRTLNIALGSLLSGFSALVIFPISTRGMLQERIAKQSQSAGIAAKLVLLSAHDTLLGLKQPIHFETLLTLSAETGGFNTGDEAYESYNKCMEDWKKCRELFSNLKWDPVHHLGSAEKRFLFERHYSSRLSRVFRVQTIVALIDMIVRFGELFGNDMSKPLDVLKDVGERVEVVLDIGGNATTEQERHNATQELFQNDLGRVRELLDWVRTREEEENRESIHMTHIHDQMPPLTLDRRDQAVLFCLLLEQLVVRSIRLYFYCQSYKDRENSLKRVG